jgi:hypothetical protein
MTTTTNRLPALPLPMALHQDHPALNAQQDLHPSYAPHRDSQSHKGWYQLTMNRTHHHWFGVVHPITKKTITQYKNLQHDPNLKDLWVPAMSKEINCLAQGKEGITKATNTVFFLSHKEICHILTNQMEMYPCIVIDHQLQKEDPNCVWIYVGNNLINYPFELTTRTTDKVSLKIVWNSTISTKGARLPAPSLRTCISRHHFTNMNI